MKIREALARLAEADIHSMVEAAFDGKTVAKRKTDAILLLTERLTQPDFLRGLYDRMEPHEQAAVAFAAHSDGTLDVERFMILGGRLPDILAQSFRMYRRTARPIDLFFPAGYALPDEMAPFVRAIAPAPEPFKIAYLTDLPDSLLGAGASHVETEQLAWHDLTAALRLVQSGGLKVSPTTLMPTAVTLRALQRNLLLFDYYGQAEGARASESIRPAGLIMILQSAGWAKSENGTLRLTRRGEAFLREPGPEALKEGFQTWKTSSLFDEIRRIENLRGQRSTGAHLTAPPGRRHAILAALAKLKPGLWVSFTDFDRAQRLWGHAFSVETGFAPQLYVGQPDYGWLGQVSSLLYWRLVQASYTRAVLMEVLAAFGLLDIAFVKASKVEDATLDLPDFLTGPVSRYEGLRAFRINALGAYLLGLSPGYTPSKTETSPVIELLPEQCVRVRDPLRLTPNDRALLERLAVPGETGMYRIDSRKVIEAIEGGLKSEELQAFLEKRSGQELPQDLKELLERLDSRCHVLARRADAVLYSVKNYELIRELLQDETLRGLCVLAEDHQLLVTQNRLPAFKRRLHELDAGLKD